MHRPDPRISQRFIISWRISRSTRASSWIATSVRRRPQVSMVFAMRSHCGLGNERQPIDPRLDQSPVASFGTTEHPSMEIQASGLRSRWRSRPLRRSRSLPRWRLSTFVSCYGGWASDPLLRRRCTGTTRRALSGLTMSAVAEGVRSISTSVRALCARSAQLGRPPLKRLSSTDRLSDVFTKSLQPAQFATIILLVFSAGISGGLGRRRNLRWTRTWPGS